jgi:hypothetical protein
MEYHRKQAKALVREYRMGEADAVERAEAALGARARDRFLLSDAQHVVAHEAGFRTWHELRRSLEQSSEWTEGQDAVVATGLRYGPDVPVEIIVRKRGWRFDVSDGGRAVELAGRPEGWREVAERVASDRYWLNVNRAGVVFVQATEGRLEHLVRRTAECSLAVYEELLEFESG